MKKTISLLLVCLIFLSINITDVSAKTQEMRGAWIATVYNIDWPTTKNNIEKQKEEFIRLLDELKAVGMNSVFVQVRPKSDALYKSSINPWSDVLTGTQGKDPGYDPLAFMIEEAHKRGLEFHAWFNPYRVTTSGTNIASLSENNPARKNPSWVINYNDKALYYDPGNPEVIKYLVDTVMEVVKNYNVDGIHFDDYFYPGQDFNDSDSHTKYGNGINLDDWRRNNVNTLVKEVYNNIKSVKANVKFGISPAGIWKNKSNDSTGSATAGKESYYASYADSVTWIKNGWIDYIVPQLYWPIGQANADYSILTEWWSNQVKGTNVKLYIGQGVYKGEVTSQITEQVFLNRNYSEISGSIYYSTRDILVNENLKQQLKNLYVNTINKYSLIGKTRYETAVEISQEGWENGSDTVFLVNGNANADGLTATPLAAAYNSPILLTKADTLNESTKAEIKRLNAGKVILIGGETVLSNKIIQDIKVINGNISVERIGGIDRYETSLLIAQKLDNIVDVNKVYICYGLGEADALSISSKAGYEKAPIILTGKDSLRENIYSWLKSENLETAFFIGGTTNITDNIINSINGITSSDVRGNRVAGSTRYETNAEILRRFYSEGFQPMIIATKGLVLADALTSGPFAAKNNAPVVLLSDELKSAQTSVLKEKNGQVLYEIGGGISQISISQLINSIK